METLMAEPSLMSEYSWNCRLEENLKQISLQCPKVTAFAQSQEIIIFCLYNYAAR